MKKQILAAAWVVGMQIFLFSASAPAFVDSQGGTGPSLPALETVLGEVSGEKILLGDLAEPLARVPLRSLGRDEARNALRTVLTRRVDEILQENEARRRGLLESPRYQLPLMIHRVQLVADKFMKSSYDGKMQPTEEQLAGALPPEWTVIHPSAIYFPSRPEAEAVEDDIRANPDRFDEMRKKHSRIATPNAGDLGTFVRGQSVLGPAVEDVLFALDEGDISPILDVQIGTALIKILAKRDLNEQEQRSFKNRTRRKLRDENLGTHVANLKKKHELTIDQDALHRAITTLLALEGKPDIAVAKLDGKEILFSDLVNAQKRPVEVRMITPEAGELMNNYLYYLDRAWLSMGVADEAESEGFRLPDGALAGMERLMVTRVLAREVLAGIKVTEDEVRAHYEQYPEMYRRSETYTMRRIVVSDKGRADELRAMLDEKPGAFKDLQEQNSEEDFTARHGSGGSARYSIGLFPAAVADILRATPKGGITPVMEYEGRYYIHLVEERLDNYQTPFNEAVWEAYKILLGQKQGPVVEAFMEGLRAKADIVVNEEGIKEAIREIRK